jgi:hypothetical protein
VLSETVGDSTLGCLVYVQLNGLLCGKTERLTWRPSMADATTIILDQEGVIVRFYRN